jgi:tetratricopeptide (TPR) repeat protein
MNKLNIEQAKYYFKCGTKKLLEKDYNGACGDFNKAIELNLNDPKVYEMLGETEMVLGETDISFYYNALEDFNKAIELNPSNIINYINRGIVHMKTQFYQDAIDDFDIAIEINPDDVKTIEMHGLASIYLEDYDSALEDFNKVIEINPKNAVAYNKRSIAKMNLQDYNDAIDDIDKALEIDPNYAEAYCNRGIVKINLHVYNDAIDDLNKVIEINPKDAEAYFYRGNARQQLKDYNGAIEDFNRTLEIDPDYTATYYFRGIAKKNLGNYDGAAEDFDDYLKENYEIYIGVSYIVAYMNASMCKKSGDHYDNAKINRHCIWEYLEVKKAWSEIFTMESYNALGWAKIRLLFDFKGAIEDFKKVINIDPDYTDWNGNIGKNIKIAEKYLNMTKEDYNKAIEIEPSLELPDADWW